MAADIAFEIERHGSIGLGDYHEGREVRHEQYRLLEAAIIAIINALPADRVDDFEAQLAPANCGKLMLGAKEVLISNPEVRHGLGGYTLLLNRRSGVLRSTKKAATSNW